MKLTLASGILHICLNQPEKLNALSRDTLEQLSAALDQAKSQNEVKAILLSGEGKGFCAGANIKELAQLNAQEGLVFSQFGQAVFRKLELLGKPSLAAIHGFALGGGCELAMAATMRMATEDTQFGQPEIKLGVIPGFGGTQRLSRLIGKGRAMELCLTGRSFTAKEAFAWGLVTELVSADQLISNAQAKLELLTSLSSMTINYLMTTMDQGYDLNMQEALALEAAHFALCCDTADKQEGVSAFLEKRTAVFTGK